MEMLKRKDGSTSRRGLWDNIRANKGSGKKPTAAMLKQEKKIKAKKAEDGTNVAKSDTSRYNKKTDTQEINKPLADVTVRPSFGQNFKSNMRNFMTTDSTDFPKERAKIKSTSNDTRKFGDNAQAKSNLQQRKQFSTAARVLSAPVAAATSALGAGVDAVRNAAAKRKEIKAMSDKMKMGGSLKPVDKAKKPGLAKLPTAVRNKMGFQKNGGKMSKKK